MELKQYQKQVMADLSQYLEFLNETHSISGSFARCWQEKGVRVGHGGLTPYQNAIDGVPALCMKVPTGGGKTFLACHSIRPIYDALPATKSQVVVWLVPSDAILTQTLAALNNPNHPYRQKLDRDFGSRVQICTKQQLLYAQNFSPSTVTEQLTICVLSYDSFRGRKDSKERLKARQENSNLKPFVDALGAPENPIPDTAETALLQVINQLSPFVIIDESHHAKTKLSMDMLRDFNPCFILELTATPKKESNIISYVDAAQLKKENMVKLPVIVYNRDSQSQVLTDAIDLRRNLEKMAIAEQEAGGRYIRPIVLFQAEPKGKKDSTTFEKLRDRLVEIGIPSHHIAIRTADVNELKNVDLMSEDCPIRYIITINALKEGWDCPFAYIVASLANKTSKIEVEQILGRILRLPNTRKNKTHALNLSYVLTSSNDFQDTLAGIVRGLNSAGFSDRDYRLANEEAAPPPQTEPKQESLFEEEQPEPTGEEDFLNFSPEEVSDALQERQELNHDVSSVDVMLDVAEQTEQQYEATLKQEEETTDFGNLAWEVRDKMPTFAVKPEFAEEIKSLRLPQFVRSVPGSIFLDGYRVLLDKDILSEGFSLRGQSTEIDFSGADAEIYKVDIQDRDGNIPRVFKMTDAEQRYFKEHFSKMPPEKRIEKCKDLMLHQLNKINSVDAGELKVYVSRIIDDMTEEQLAAVKNPRWRLLRRSKPR